ncbi:radical SAM protein [Methanonatronarchaeum sp. AMET-Sl]|uniref:radical SAM protein n=1 Tax=Methanonatronarchaeum sp. AMET-Sl TaxID=3037654 RepID=UPI00244DFDE2|nr:radical SAM protein [Methanonatronarchaeum sp. AMET-Sl]WGI17629.1 radical SAM protein [Methanonatronarchaeum sp. AMET-Sl]
MSRVRRLSESGQYDVVCGANHKLPVFNAKSSYGSHSMLKLLLSNECKFDCLYCQNRCSNNGTSITPVEVSRLANYLKKEGVCGLFLSSGVYGDVDSVMSDLVRAAELTRERGFDGYIHLKVMPGVSRHHIKRTAEVADRLSINIEAPNNNYLNELSSIKDMKIDIERRLRWIDKMDVSHSTQFVVGVLNEKDQEILDKTNELYSKYNTQRVYYSGFKPLNNTPLQTKNPVQTGRIGRLYQSDWLLRKYDYKLKEIKQILIDGMLPDRDPKLEIARKKEPINIEIADIKQLMRIPGIGPKTARKIHQNKNHINSRKDLKKIGVPKKSIPFIEINKTKQKKLTGY